MQYSNSFLFYFVFQNVSSFNMTHATTVIVIVILCTRTCAFRTSYEIDLQTSLCLPSELTSLFALIIALCCVREEFNSQKTLDTKERRPNPECKTLISITSKTIRLKNIVCTLAGIYGRQSLFEDSIHSGWNTINVIRRKAKCLMSPKDQQ